MGKPRSINDGVLAYMEHKYNDKLEYVSAWGSSFTSPGVRQILVSSDALQVKEILVVIKGEGKEETYRDNYMDWYFKTQTSEYISQVANKYFNESTVSISIAAAPSAEGITFETDFDEYIRNADRFTHANIDIEVADEDVVREFLDELKNLDFYFSFSIDVLSTNEGYTAQYFYGDDVIHINRRTLR